MPKARSEAVSPPGVPLSWRFALRHPAHFIALGGGCGLVPFAPGTAGTLLAWLVYALLAPARGGWFSLALLAGSFAIGVWASARTARALGEADPGAIVWDEMVAFWLVLGFTPPGLLWQACAFALFRLFDIWKPAPIRYFDRKLKGGFGVMFDDLLAALYAVLVLALAWRVTGE